MDAFSPQIPVPGGVYLCQVGPSVSCGACCGLYNVPDPSRGALIRLLERRSEIFSSVPRRVEAILGFGKRPAVHMPGRRPHPGFHHCPYLGLVGRDRSRVGCLLHPLNPDNAGVDYRGLSHYGGLACSRYFCRATHRLPERIKAVLRSVFDDWHPYGLVVTEERLLRRLFRAIEGRIRGPVGPEAATAAPEGRQALRDALCLKLAEPVRVRGGRPAVHHLFQEDERPEPTDVDDTEAVVHLLCPDADPLHFEAALRHTASVIEAAAAALKAAPPAAC